MQGSSGDALFLQRQRQLIGAALGGGKHQGLVEPLARKEGFEEAVLVTQVVGKHQALLDLAAVFLRDFDFDALRVARHAVGHIADHAIERGGEQQGLALGRGGSDDGVDVFGKAHVKHAVSFVEDQHFDVRELDLAPIQVIKQTAGGGDDDVALALELLDLGEHRCAANEAGGVEPAQGLAVSLHRLLDLLREFARRGQHQNARATALRRATIDDAVQRGQGEGGGLAAAGMAGYEQVVSGDGSGNGLNLHRGGDGIAGLFDGLEEVCGEAEIFESHVFLPVSCVPVSLMARTGRIRALVEGLNGIAPHRNSQSCNGNGIARATNARWAWLVLLV